MDLNRMCTGLRNFFVKVDEDIHSGTYTVSEHTLTPSGFLREGQYFRVVGSVFNDGVYKFGDETDMARLQDETFEGSIWAMRVPPSFLSLANEYDRLNAKIEELALVSEGFSSESFDGYSYTIAASAPAELTAWKNRLDSELNQYRRISVI